ncbi:exocyst complex component 7-like [Paramacrobiotus metropolitanus]|uniref:exocyst complex component 7-like n=1 Tax=Paramacrobiotus metropolitanus TaxID=2943436 RepID=UPI0024464186|nr:exocyst complex component 7-like [Paramacrobiotus metropolitanus]
MNSEQSVKAPFSRPSLPLSATPQISLSRRRSSTKDHDKLPFASPNASGEKEYGGPNPSDPYALQETLRALAPETSDTAEVYWLPIAVAQLGMRAANVPRMGLHPHQRVGGSGESEGTVDRKRALPSAWHHAAKTEEKLYDLQFQSKNASVMEDAVDAGGKMGGAFEWEEDDEDLQELLDDLKVVGFNRNFRRGKERRSKRFTSALEQEIAERNQHLRTRMEQMNARVKRFEKGFEALDSLAVRMDTLAESSKLRVQFLEQCLVPLYNESARHQICKNNAERAIEAIDAALYHYKVPEQLSAVIQAGPVKNLPAYCAALEKVKASADFFADFNTSTPEYEQVSGLYRTGRENLIKEFRELLRMHSKPVPAVMIKDAIVLNLRDPSVSHELAHFAESAHNDLKLVTQWFLKTNDQYDFMEVYANFRSGTMIDALEQFRTFYKDNLSSNELGGDLDVDRKSLNISMGKTSGHSGDAQSRIGYDDDSRSLATVGDDSHNPRTGTLKRAMKSTPRKKAAQAGTGTASLFRKFRKLKPNSAKKATGVHVGIDEETYQQVEVYMALVSAFLKLVESEVSLMYGIIPIEHMREVFDRIIKQPMERFEKMGKDLAGKIMHHVQNGDFSAVLLLLQILEHFQDLQPLFNGALEGCTQQTQHNWINVHLVFRSAVIRTMDGFLASIKQSNDRGLPPDGSIHELTTNTIAFLSNLVDYRPLFDALTADEGAKKDGKAAASAVANAPYAKQGAFHISHNFPQYLNFVVTHLLANLTVRSENYSDYTLKAIFLLNNTTYMYNYLKQAGIIEVMKEDNPNIDKLIGGRTVEQRKAYMECWNVLSRLLTEAIGDAGLLRTPAANDLSLKHSTTSDYNIKLKPKDRDAIKERCTAIIKELQQQAAKQEKYSVPDTNLRLSLQQQNRDTILSLYTTYRERYSHIPFTTHHEKYLPYTAAQVSNMLEHFFSQDAFSSALHSASQTFRIDDA